MALNKYNDVAHASLKDLPTISTSVIFQLSLVETSDSRGLIGCTIRILLIRTRLWTRNWTQCQRPNPGRKCPWMTSHLCRIPELSWNIQTLFHSLFVDQLLLHPTCIGFPALVVGWYLNVEMITVSRPTNCGLAGPAGPYAPAEPCAPCAPWPPPVEPQGTHWSVDVKPCSISSTHSLVWVRSTELHKHYCAGLLSLILSSCRWILTGHLGYLIYILTWKWCGPLTIK